MMNSDWQWVQLGEISEVISKGTTPTTHGVAFLDSGIPFLRAEDVVGGAVDVNSVKYYVDEKTHNKLLSRSQLQPGDFLITIAGSLGRVGYVPLNAPPLNCNQAVAFVRLKPNIIDLNFLLYVFQYEGITKSLLDVQKVGTIGNLNLEQIRDFKIPLPPLTEQKRIASLLARADRLRTLRRTAHELGESLLQSVFLEMFGEPKFNDKKWQLELGEDLFKKIGYGVGTPPPFIDKGNIFLRAMNIKPSGINLNKVVYFSSEYEKEMSRSKVKAGDVVVVRRGANTGDTALIPPELDGAYVGYDLILHPDETKMLGSYFVKLMNTDHFRNHIYQIRERAAQQGLNAEQIGELVIPVPPLSLQEEFAGVVARVESLRGRMSEAGRQVNGLFESLLSQSFDGGR